MAHHRPEKQSPQVAAASPPLLRMPIVMQMTGLGRSTIYRMIAESKFPRPVRLGERAVAWRRTDLDRWSQARPIATH